MSLYSFNKKLVLLFLFLVIPAVAVIGLVHAEEDISHEKWKSWIGKKVDVDYTACDRQGCILVRNAELKEVNDKAVVVIVRGSPFYIPKYMITRVALSKAQGKKLKSD
jgi:hypothetical protein